MSRVVLSDSRCTWYSGPSNALNNARTVLWAATHGVLSAAKISHGASKSALPLVNDKSKVKIKGVISMETNIFEKLLK